MMCKRLYLFICLVVGCALTGLARPVVTNTFMTTNGLSDNSARCALRDSYGLLWIGTENGLNWYDGQRMHPYRDMVNHFNALETNTVMSLLEYKRDIWFGGTAGLYIFDRPTSTFSRFSKKTRYGVIISSMVPKMLMTEEGRIWIFTQGQGLFIYDTQKDELVQDSRHGTFFSDGIIGYDGLVYTVTLNGQLSVFGTDGRHLQDYWIEGYQQDKNPISITSDKEGIWLAYDTHLLHVNPVAKSIEPCAVLPQTGTIRDLESDRAGRLLVGSDNGVYRYSHAGGSVERIDKPSSRYAELTDEQVKSLAWDTDGALLVLTRTGGVCTIDMQDRGMGYIPLPQTEISGSHNMVRALCRSPKGAVWIGTDNGLFVSDATMQHIEAYGNEQLPREINALAMDGDNLWIGSRHSGIRVLNGQTGQVESHVYSSNIPYTIASNEVNGIYRTSDGQIFVLTTWGFSRYDRTTHTFHGYASISAQTSFLCMQEDSRGWLWASSNNRGLFCRQNKDGSFNAFRSKTIGYQTVSVMFADSKGDLWAATNGGGFYRYNAKEGDFERFDVLSSALYGQAVSFIEEDQQHTLWIGTTAGVVSLGPSRSQKEVNIYGSNQEADYYRLQRSSCKSSAGNILFGADGGIYSFSPAQMHPSSDLRRVYIHGISFPYADDNESELVRLGLDVPLYTRKEIELPYADNSFTLHFATARYSGMPTPKYEYMMEGIDNAWAHGTETSEATYANLSPGHYTFLLRIVGQTADANTTRLDIVILPPWYRTTLAYVLYVLFAIFAIGFALWYTHRLMNRRYQRQTRRFQAEQEKETFQSKIRFFIDLVHEIRTPLTLINLPLEQIDEEVRMLSKPSLNNYVAAIRRNMNYLLGITNQLLDFQKAENGGITLVRRNTDVGEMLREIYSQFHEAAMLQGIQLQLQLPDAPVVVSMDSDKMTKVMMNLVGNAMKYARKEIIIRLSEENMLSVMVIDDGPGVPAEGQRHIFDRYYQIGHDTVASSVGTGLGLAYAKMLAQAHEGDLTYSDAPGSGSCFTLTLPLVKAEQDEAQQRELQHLSADGNGEESMKTTEIDGEEEDKATKGVRYTVLLVEDNAELLQATTEGLHRWYKVLRAHDGLEALEQVKRYEVDIVVSDVMMPRMDGIQLCQHLKENIETSHLPIILLTAKTSVEAKLEGMESGADIYLEKPFSIRQLHLQVENLLRMRQQFYEHMRSLEGFGVPVAKEDDGDDILQLNQQDMRFMERMQEAITENLRDEDFSIDILAEQLNMSRSSFYRKIKALTGQTPTDYLKTARMNEAARLLREGCRSSEVCERVGFTSSSYFAKCFRAQFGVLPKDYIAK